VNQIKIAFAPLIFLAGAATASAAPQRGLQNHSGVVPIFAYAPAE
jgi:hypothetical protein